MCVEAVRHELKLSIRWDEGDGAVILKARQAHALVKFDIFEFHRLALATCVITMRNISGTIFPPTSMIHRTVYIFLQPE